MRIQATIDTEPKALQRPMMTCRGKIPSTYYSKRAREEMDTLRNSILNALTKEQRRQIRAELKNAANELKVDVEIVFYMRIPSSYSKIRKTRLEGTPHTKKPDLDNLIKNLLDRGTGILWTDDSRLSSIVAKKKWSEKPRIDLAVEFGRLTNL